MATINIQDMSDSDRFAFLINNIIEHKEVWLLEAEDASFAMFEDNEGRSFIPIWPGKEFAEQFANDDWDGYVAERMGLGEFLEWMQELKEDEIMIGAFPYLDQKAMAVDPIDMKNQILQAGKK